MEFLGNLKMKVGERSGDGQNGPWRINSYLLETVEMYPKRMVVEVKDDIEEWEKLMGKNVIVKFRIDAHEWNGRWYNQLRAYAITDNTIEEQQRRTRKRTQPTGEVVVANAAGGTVTEPGTGTATDAGTQAGAGSGNGDGEKKDDYDLPF